MALKDSRRKKTTSSIAKSLAENFDYEDALSRERVQNLAKMEKIKTFLIFKLKNLFQTLSKITMRQIGLVFTF